MAVEIFYDPASGRPYRVNPATGQSEWVDGAPAQPFRQTSQPQPMLQQPAQGTYSTHDKSRAARKQGVPRWLWGVGGLVIGLVLGAGLGGGAGDTTTTTAAAVSETASPVPASSAPVKSSATEKSSAKSESESAKTEPATQVVVIKDARTFGDAFDANQVAAERKWNGKRVQLTAEIRNITDRRVTLTGVTTEEFSLTQVACKLSDPEQALSVKNGDQATVVGTVDGQSMGVIELKDCVLK